MRLQVRIEGHLMDIDDKTSKMATTLQHFDFLNIGGSVKANRTNRISLPLTNNNRQQLEQIAPLSIISQKPYQNLAISILDGLDIIPVGVCQITSISDRIFLNCQSTLKSFFTALNGKYLNDLDTSSWDGLWDDNRRDTVRNTSSGLVCPVVNTGQFVDGTSFLNIYTHGRANVPFFYYKTIIDKIFDLAGFEKSGDVFSDTRYLSMAMSTRLVYNQQWINNKLFRAFQDAKVISVPNGGAPQLHSITLYDSSVLNADGWLDISNGKYTVDGAATDFIKAKFHFSFKEDSTLDGLVVGIAILKNGSPLAITNDTIEINTWSVVTTDYVELKDGDEIICRVTTFSDGGAQTCTLRDIRFYNEIPNTTDTLLTQQTDWYIYFSQLLPRILCTDFIKDFMKMFGLVMREKNGEVEFKNIDDIIEDEPTSEELALEDKDKGKPEINYTLTGFAKQNWFRWVVQDDEEVITEDYAAGSIDIDNDLLNESLEYHESLFTASDEKTELGILNSAYFPIYDQGSSNFTKAASFGFRLVMLRNDDGLNVRFKAGTSRTDYFIGYFQDQGQSNTLHWQDLLSDYYSRYTHVLQAYRQTKPSFFISRAQVANMDLFLPKQKDGVKYVVETVENYVPGKSASFQMIRV